MENRATAVFAGGRPPFSGSIPPSLPSVRATRLVALAVTGPRRSPLAPEIPTLAEAGVTGVDVPSWYTVIAPARTPRAVADRLRAELKRIADHAEFREQIGRQAIEARTLAPGEWPVFIRSEVDKWGKVVQEANIKAD